MLRSVFWDVQHGSAACIRTPSNSYFAIDLGTGSHSYGSREFSPLVSLRDDWGVVHLDGVIITHPHRDHLDDIFNLDALSPRVLLRPSHLTDDETRSGNRKQNYDVIDQYLKVCRGYTCDVSCEASPFAPSNNGGVAFQTFVPHRCPTSNLNNHSVVTVISYASSKLLIPGDNEPLSWAELLEDRHFIAAIDGTDILVAPHHGRDSGFSSDLFRYIHPKLTVISDGPFCESSATERYAAHTSGWQVHSRSGGTQERQCVTTRNDGVVVIEFGALPDRRPYIEATID